MPGCRLTREFLRSQAKPVGQSKREAKVKSPRQSYVHALKPLDYWTLTTVLSASGCIDLESTISGVTLTNKLDYIEEGTYEGKIRAEQDLKPPPTN
jgi:hypothetical protein